MTFDTTFFGYGMGLVLAGWAVGMVVSLVFNTYKKVGQI
jgi:hypothetical protein